MAGLNMSECYFCGGCHSTVNIAVSNNEIVPSEMFRISVCKNCAEMVRSTLFLLRTFTPKNPIARRADNEN